MVLDPQIDEADQIVYRMGGAWKAEEIHFEFFAVALILPVGKIGCRIREEVVHMFCIAE